MISFPKPVPKVLEKRGKKRAKEAQWQATRQIVLKRDGWKCRVTGHGAHDGRVEVHHVMPRATGGIHQPANCIAVCALHHSLIHQKWIRVVAKSSKGADGSLRFDGKES